MNNRKIKIRPRSFHALYSLKKDTPTGKADQFSLNEFKMHRKAALNFLDDYFGKSLNLNVYDGIFNLEKSLKYFSEKMSKLNVNDACVKLHLEIYLGNSAREYISYQFAGRYYSLQVPPEPIIFIDKERLIQSIIKNCDSIIFKTINCFERLENIRRIVYETLTAKEAEILRNSSTEIQNLLDSLVELLNVAYSSALSKTIKLIFFDSCDLFFISGLNDKFWRKLRLEFFFLLKIYYICEKLNILQFMPLEKTSGIMIKSLNESIEEFANITFHDFNNNNTEKEVFCDFLRLL